MKFLSKHHRKVAAVLLLVMLIQLLAPARVYALTSGPTQPETKGFEPIGNSDMVDLFSGDFSYNIPLLDVGGYPVNMSYHSGASMDDEASWVGYGWSLNPGTVNRQMRGLPDDFNGTDQQQREMSMKDHITFGGKFSMILDLLGIPTDKITKSIRKKKLNLSLTVSEGIKSDNYRGVGVELGADAGISLSDYAAGSKTNSDSTDLTDGKFTGSLGINLSSMDGATVSLNAEITRKSLDNDDKATSVSKSLGFGYNSRTGLEGMTLKASFSPVEKFKEDHNLVSKLGSLSSFISFNGETFTPTIDHPTKSNSFTFSLKLGPELFVALPAVGATGFYSKQSISEKLRTAPAYGYLYSERGRDNIDALMDFNREKDIPFSNQVKYLPIPIPTYDLFTATSQDGAGQYRAYRGSSGVFFDNKVETKSEDFSLGIELGASFYADAGADLHHQGIVTKTQKWIDRNAFLSKGDFQDGSSTSPLYEPAYFKRVGEPVPYDPGFVNKIKGTTPVAVSLPSRIDNATDGAKASDLLRTPSSRNGESIDVLKRDKREVRNTTFSYLTAKEAANHALEKNIIDYKPDSIVISGCNAGAIKNTISRNAGYRKGHHISEITVTGDDGKRSIYGIPVYNTCQEETSFSIGQNLALRKKGLINYSSTDDSISNNKGIDHYYSKEKMPPYATSYLLTAILSSDYVDRTGNGVTDDDLGTAVKFNYTMLDQSYHWRTPFAFGPDTANYNEGLMSSDQDDKANYVYGEKEIWYLHSIESKTMLAQFVTENRDDGLGVVDNRGKADTTVRLKRLKEIRLYSKSDLKLNGNDLSKTIPIKVVHFVYDYSTCPGLPNSMHNTGKLTLKRVYFTFGQNNKGMLNPYDFQYDTSYNFYNYRQYDRWGTFKDAANNPGGLNNSEYPYTLQDTALTNKFASAWQLKKIILPSGGSININYESDDYAYVQDKRASAMCSFNGVGSGGSSTNLVDADYIYINLPYAVSSQQEMMDRYFEGVTNLYYKCLLDLDNKGHKEYVPGYAELDGPPTLVGTDVAKIKLKKKNNTNPIARAGWQFIRTSLPKYAYPGSENIEDNESDLVKSIKALVTALGTIRDLIFGFEKRARQQGFSNNIDLSKSWVRLCSPDFKKLGGGSRVKRIDISDDWAAMSGTSGAKTATYSQVYDYTTTDAKGRTISTGVASYEPMLGNDENPFRQPITYEDKQFLGLNNYFYIEEPFCESLFPAANVGYSKVTVKTIGSGDDASVNRTGTVVSEFYTARDYPVSVNVLGLEERKPATDKILKLIGNISFDMIGLSQGYSIELNDMHGKPRSVNVYNKSGENISSVQYFYKSVNELAEKRELDNDVKVINPDGSVTDGTIGMDVEMFTDMRQQTTDNLGESVAISGGLGSILIFPLPFFFPGLGVNYDRRSYRSSSSIKIINRFAIQYKVQKIENGSSITSENLLWDAETGNVLLTKTQNEFNDPVYSFAYPAHWEYDRMGQAYRNLGTLFTNFSSNSAGQPLNATYNALLTPGDELIDINADHKYWVINSPVYGGLYSNRIIDANGNFSTLTSQTLRLVRSGRRNMANTAIATITSLNNPISGDQLDISQLTKALDAKATIFDEAWSVPFYCTGCSGGYQQSADGAYCYKDTAATKIDSLIICEGDQIGNYNCCGSYIYTNYNADGTAYTRHRIDTSNHFWIGFPADQSTYCIYTPDTIHGSETSRMHLSKSIKDTLNGSNGKMALLRATTVRGPLNRCGIWACPYVAGYANRPPYSTWLGFSKTVNVPASKIYYIGIGADNQFRFKIDGVTIRQDLTDSTQNFNLWHIYPVYLTYGSHLIEMDGWNSGGPAAFGAEIYNNTATELQNAHDVSDLNLVFSTANLVGEKFQVGNYSCPYNYSLVTDTTPYICRQIIPTSRIINPYAKGILGNWRPKSQYVYQVSRENLVTDPGKFGSTDIRKSGAYSIFNPFWKYNSSSLVWDQNPTNDIRWIAANEVTNFNSKGLEIENKDALNRYSAALFGYQESLPVAVASNSQFREIGYDGFEDYGFTLGCATDTCPDNKGHFSFQKLLNGSNIDTTSAYAHSGKYSLLLNGTVDLVKTVYTGNNGPVYDFDNSGHILYGQNELAKGFSPIPGKKYVLSFWVKDGSPRDATTTLQVKVNGTSLVNSGVKWPVVEGWKRVEVQFVLSSLSTNFDLQFYTGDNTDYIDDVRIHPFDGELKSFAYDPSSLRLMAELDENNFATFYEYDDEGTLIRVKKETERGIMTIKETRSGYRKRH